MRPELRLAVGIVATVAFTVASFAVNLADEPSAFSRGSPDGGTVLVARGCSGCHVVDRSGGGGVGPNLTNLAARAADRVNGLSAEAYVRQSILDPQAFLVPGFEGLQMPSISLTEPELDAVVAHLLRG
jgi:mono/diheme cytochrome c family protein